MSLPTSAGLDQQPEASVPAVLALGSNLGDRAATLRSAVAEIRAFEGLRVRAVSPVVETEPVGGPVQPDFLNAVVLVTTSLSPLALLAACQRVEGDHGRVREARWGPRTLDVDVIAYDDLVAESAVLVIPHPRAHERAFVLLPWALADPQACLPTAGGLQRVGDLAEAAMDRPGVRVRDDVALEVEP